ncbi:MAG TPA: hypothetical protein V6D09_11390 [Leptolyngbyaceae cyanobacterium]
MGLSRKVQDLKQRRWQPRSPAMAAGLSDRLWSAEELLTKVVALSSINTK